MKMTRREFIATAIVGTAVSSGEIFPAFSEGTQVRKLQSNLLPARSGALFNVARNRVVYQSSSADDDHMGHLVTDGSAATYWEAGPGEEQWITLDLGRAFRLDRLTIHWGGTQAARYHIDVSTEEGHPAASWKTIATRPGSESSAEDVPMHAVEARYIRLTGNSIQPHQGFSITELEAWSSEDRPAPVTPPQAYSRDGGLLANGWWLQCAQFSASSATEIASPEFIGSDWIPARASATVLASYLAAEAIPSPYFGNQVAQISDGFFSRNDFWYRNTFTIEPDCGGRRLWLVFEGVNWKADLYCNGVHIGRIDGAFMRGRFEITHVAHIGGLNCIAVRIHQVEHPGAVQHKVLGQHYRNGGVLGLDSPTFLSSIGWNWVPTIPGREIGIWNDVRFETTGDVLVVDPWVTSAIPNKDLSCANLTSRTELRNVSDEIRHCVLTLAMEGVHYRQKIDLQPRETRSVAIDPTGWAALAIRNPRLWWPNGYGDPFLHSMTFGIECNGTSSDQETVSFGIRSFEYQTDDSVLRILVNHQPILCRGGNWGMDDALLLCDDAGYDLRVRLHRECNLNMIRNWVGMVGRKGFYEACDRYGILVWDDFWIANPADGPDPLDHVMFMDNVVDKIYRRRHHACLALYCGRNEGMPPADLDTGMRNAVATLDGSRFYIPASDRGLVTGHGPYDNQDPAWYFAHRGATFHSEQGIVCVPAVETMRAMMPGKDLWPISDMWAIHDYQENRSTLYTERIASRYGRATDIEDYCRKAQMVNLESAKAMYECLRSRRGSGQLVWMTQAAWPALICQLYDYYFDATAAYFGAKLACQPLHILWDQASNRIKVANDTRLHYSALHVEAWIYDLAGHEQWHRTADLDAPANSAQDAFPLEAGNPVSRVFFVRLQLRHRDNLVAENFYWSPAQDGDCTALHSLPKIAISANAEWRLIGRDHVATVQVTNPTPSVALAIHLSAINGITGERILPAIYEDNYFSLLPGAKRTIRALIPDHALSGETPQLVLSGWNVEGRT